MAGEASPLKVFVSYSRADVAFADQLVLALQDKGFEAILDRHDISGAENWRERLGKLILSGDAVTFVLTEKSAASEICKWEVSEAKALGKRIIPVTPGPMDGVTPPEELAELNWIPFYADPAIPGSGFYYGVVRLNEALSVDLEWLRAQTRYSERALEWARQKADDLLLRGEALREAEAWLARTPAGAHPPDRVREYLAASGDVEQHRQAAAKAQLQEREQALKTAEAAVAESRAAQRKLRRFSIWALVAGVLLLAIAIPGNYFAATRTLDANDRRAALFADAANDLSRQGNYNRALLMALAGDPPARVGLLESLMRPDGNLVVRNALVRAYASDGVLPAFPTGKSAQSLAAVGDGERFVTIFEDGTAQMWRAGANLQGETLSLPYPVREMFPVGDGDTLILQAAYGAKEPACAWRASTQKVVRCFGGTLGAGDADLATVAVDMNRRWVMGSSGRQLLVWNIADGAVVGSLATPFSAMDTLAGSADEGFVVATRNEELLVWTPEDEEVVGPISSGLGDIVGIVTSEEVGVIVGTDMGQVGILDVDTGKTSAAFQTFGEELTEQEGIARLALSSDDRVLLFTSSEGQFRTIDILAGIQEEPFGRRDDVVDGVYLSKAGIIAALTHRGEILLAAFEQAPERKTFADMLGIASGLVDESMDDNQLLRTSRGQIASDLGRYDTRVWDPSTRETVVFPTAATGAAEPGVSSVSVSEDSATLLRVRGDVVELWKKGGAAAGAPIDLHKDGYALSWVELLPQGDSVLYVLAKDDARFAAVRRLDTGQDVAPLRELEGDTVLASPDGQQIADVATHSLRVFRAGQTEPWSIESEETMRAFTFSPDGALLVTATSEGAANVWRIGDSRPSLSVTRHKAGYSGTALVAFHPNGELFATAFEYGRVTLWRTNERAPLQEIRLPVGQLQGLAIDSSGKFIAVLMDGEQLLYPIDPIVLADVDTQTRMACERLGSRKVSGFSDRDFDEYSFIGKFDSARDRDPCLKLGITTAAPGPSQASEATGEN
jgi:WD40 repeat protein